MTMHVNPEKLAEPSQTHVPKAEVVMKICLLVSVAFSALLIVLAVAGRRSILDVAGSVIPLVALQWFFYTVAKARRDPVER
jgi:hypothetical protein